MLGELIVPDNLILRKGTALLLDFVCSELLQVCAQPLLWATESRARRLGTVRTLSTAVPQDLEHSGSRGDR